MKKCRICKKVKSFTDFYKHQRAKDGLQGYCISCNRIIGKEYRKNNPDKERARKKRHYV